MHDAQPAGCALFELHGGERGVVAPDGDELRHVQPQQRHDGVVEQCRVGGGVRARDAEVRPAAEMDAADRVDGQRHHVIDITAHDPLEPIADAEHLDIFDPRADRRRADDAVDAGGRAAPDEDGEVLVVLHALILSGPVGAASP